MSFSHSNYLYSQRIVKKQDIMGHEKGRKKAQEKRNLEPVFPVFSELLHKAFPPTETDAHLFFTYILCTLCELSM